MADVTRDDVAFIREVTEAARNAPLLGGRFLLMWGTLLFVAYLAHWGVVTGHLGTPSDAALGVIWGGFGALGGIGTAIMAPVLNRKPGRNAFGNRVDMAVWNGAGFALFAYAGTAMLAAALGRVSYVAVDLIMPVAFGLYGTAFLATAAASGQAWLRGFAVGAYVAAAGSVWLSGGPAQYLWGAFAALLVAALPGFLLLRREPPALPRETD